jgi:hypothetical protein
MINSLDTHGRQNLHTWFDVSHGLAKYFSGRLLTAEALVLFQGNLLGFSDG